MDQASFDKPKRSVRARTGGRIQLALLDGIESGQSPAGVLRREFTEPTRLARHARVDTVRTVVMSGESWQPPRLGSLDHVFSEDLGRGQKSAITGPG